MRKEFSGFSFGMIKFRKESYFSAILIRNNLKFCFMEFTLEKRIAAGIHLGHPTRYWNPKISVYTYGVRDGIRLLDLVKTCRQLREAQKFLKRIKRYGKNILFIGTKTQAKQTIKERAKASQSFFVRERWLGGILTNWSTVQRSLLQLHRLEREKEKSVWTSLSKKNATFLRKRLEQLERYFGGLKGIQTIPDLVIVIGQITELVRIRECRKLKIPIICRLDTDCDPSLVKIGVPINDDSSARINLFFRCILPRIKDGYNLWMQKKLKRKNSFIK
jgi:small subunit ribosomal protein S2